MPSDLALKAMNHLHRIVLRATGGRLGWTAGGMPVIELTTTGQQWPTSLDHADLALSGRVHRRYRRFAWRRRPSSGVVSQLAGPSGGDRVYRGQTAQRMRAEIAGPEERDRIWPLITGDHRNYAGYQRKTKREIPLVLLRPMEG